MTNMNLLQNIIPADENNWPQNTRTSPAQFCRLSSNNCSYQRKPLLTATSAAVKTAFRTDAKTQKEIRTQKNNTT